MPQIAKRNARATSATNQQRADGLRRRRKSGRAAHHPITGRLKQPVYKTVVQDPRGNWQTALLPLPQDRLRSDTMWVDYWPERAPWYIRLGAWLRALVDWRYARRRRELEHHDLANTEAEIRRRMGLRPDTKLQLVRRKGEYRSPVRSSE